MGDPMRKLILSTLSTLALLIYPLYLSAQNSFSLSLDVNGAAGDQAVTSLNVSLIRLLLFRSSARIYKMRTALPCVLYTMQVRLCMRALMLAMSYPMHRHCQSRAQIRLLWRSALRLWVVKPLPTAVWSARFAFEQQPRFLARKFGWCVLNSVEAGDLRPSCLIFALRCKGHPHPPTFSITGCGW